MCWLQTLKNEVAKHTKAENTSLRNMGVGRIFSRGGFQNFSREAKSGEISFFLLETNKTTFFCLNFQNPVGSKSPCPSLPTTMRVRENENCELRMYCLYWTQRRWSVAAWWLPWNLRISPRATFRKWGGSLLHPVILVRDHRSRSPK